MCKKILLCVGITILFLGVIVIPSMSGNNIISSFQQVKESSIDFPLNNGLLAYWKSDECNGTTLWDCSGHNYNGTIYADWTSGGCLVFDGIDDYVDFDNHSENLGYNKTDNYFISFYFKSTSTSTGSIFSMSHTDTARAFAYLDLSANGTISYKTGDETCLFELYTAGTYNDGSWHFVEVKFYGNITNPTIEIWVDGNLDGIKTDWLIPLLSEDFKTAKMGRRSTTKTYYFDGLVDEFRINKSDGDCPPPSKPIIDGPKKVEPGQICNFTFTSIDPQGLDIVYIIDWCDGKYDTSNPLPSGTAYEKCHSWYEIGTILLRAKAINSCGGESDWSIFEITVPRTRAALNSLFHLFLERFPMLERLLSLLL